MIVFTHIPKTAGSTITEWITNYIPFDRAYIVNHDSNDRSALNGLDFEAVDYVGGHVRFAMAWPLIGPGTYIATLRDPLERILSHYFFAIRHGGFSENLLANGVKQGFESFYQIAIRDSGRLNLQCQYFHDSATAEAAIDTIVSYYRVVWDSHVTDEVLPYIGDEILKMPSLEASVLHPPTRAYEAPVATDSSALLRGARPANYREFLSPARAQEILAENSEDQALYAWLREKGGIFKGGAGRQE